MSVSSNSIQTHNAWCKEHNTQLHILSATHCFVLSLVPFIYVTSVSMNIEISACIIRDQRLIELAALCSFN